MEYQAVQGFQQSSLTLADLHIFRWGVVVDLLTFRVPHPIICMIRQNADLVYFKGAIAPCPLKVSTALLYGHYLKLSKLVIYCRLFMFVVASKRNSNLSFNSVHIVL